MKLAIHNKGNFSQRWIAYCEQKNIPFKVVNCYDFNIIQNLDDCNILIWHHDHMNPKDILFAKQLLYALEHAGKTVFPDFNTGWHFDDKVGQKYLLEALKLPLVPSYVFYDEKKALEWVNATTYPKVWKLRGGAGGSNVSLVKNKTQAIKLVKKAFRKGFKQYNAVNSLKDRWRKFKRQQGSLLDVGKGVVRLLHLPFYAQVLGNEIGYIYFQEFIPNNDSDIRIIVIDRKAFGLKRMVRKGDFRASGSGDFYNKKEDIDIRCVELAFEATEKIKSKSAVFDFVFDIKENPLIVELSYGFSMTAYDSCPGYWDENLHWHEGEFNPQGWMIDEVIKQMKIEKQ